MRPLLEGQLIQAGVDYLTITVADPYRRDKARRLAYSLIEWELKGDMEARPFTVSGYEGVKCGSVFVGERHDGVMLRTGGDVAAKFWRRMYDVAQNVTRIDLQATYRVTRDPSAVVHTHYREFQRWSKKRRRPVTVWRIQKNDGGYTAYTGAPQSDTMGRIYNKAAQSKLDFYKSCVRYEVRFGDKRALKVSSGVRSLNLTSSEIAHEVLRFFRSRGAQVEPLLVLLSTPATAVDWSLPRRVSDFSRRLEWLRKQVRPSICAGVHSGSLDCIAQALGLTQDHTCGRCAQARGPTKNGG